MLRVHLPRFNRVFAATITCGVATVACSPPASSTSHVGATPAAAVFEPAVVSTRLPEFSITFTPDGRSLYFGRASADRATLTIMMADKVDGRWTNTRVAPFSGRYRDVDPFVTPDGRRLYFSSDRPRLGATSRGLHTWFVERTAKGWSEPIDPGEPLNSDSLDVFVSVSRAGVLLFSSRRDGHLRVYSTRFDRGKWEAPRPIRFGAITEGASNPMISPSGRFVVLVMDQPGQGSDLFVSCRSASGWSEPRRLSEAVNSRYADFAPALDPGESMLYFTSERPGVVAAQPDSVRPPGDIYQISARAAGLRCP